MRIRPDWIEVWEDSYIGIRDQLKAERAAGRAKRYGMRRFDDEAIDLYSRREAEKRVQEAINRWNAGE